MIKIQENINLKKYHTLGFDVRTKYFIQITNPDQVLELSQDSFFKKTHSSSTTEGKEGFFYILGEGSNTFFTKDYDGLVVLNKIGGIDIIEEMDDTVLVKCGSGVIWDDVVAFAMSNGYFGPENLVAIPGTVGASVVQNIGAYGVEIEQFVHQVEYINLKTQKKGFFSKEECKFGYRDSIFKSDTDIFVTSVVYKFRKDIQNYEPDVSYGSLKDIFEERLSGFEGFVPALVADTVSEVRASKLPDWTKIGTAGSFFKNVFVSTEKFESLQKNHPDLKGWAVGDGKFKLASGQLLEMAVGKGFEIGGVGTYKQHALVLVNNGNGTVEEFQELISVIQDKVFGMFGVEIESEVIFV